MPAGKLEVIIITLFVIAVGARLLNSAHKDTLLLIFGIAAIIFVITTMKNERIVMGE